MRTLFLNLLLSCALAAGAVAADIPWQSDYESALTDAPTDGKPVLLYFTAPWCGPCRMMAATTFSDAKVQEAIGAMIPVKVDFDQNPELVGKYRVQGIPNLILLNRFGEVVASHVGYSDPAQLTAWLAAHNAAATVAVSKAQIAAKKSAEVDAALASNDPAARERGTAQLFDSYVNKDDFAPVAAKLIEEQVERRRAEMVSHLNDKNLAIRILLANLLSKTAGASLAFDPWAPAVEREEAVRTLSK